MGYQQGDAVYVRAFLPKEDPRSAPNTGRKAVTQTIICLGDSDSQNLLQVTVDECLQLELDSPSRGDDEEVQKCLSQESIEIVALNAPEVSEEVTAQTKQKGNTTAVGRNLNNRKFQPVEVLTATGEWMSGYFIHACVMVANFVGMERRFTLFDANGEMHVFFGQIRVPSK